MTTTISEQTALVDAPKSWHKVIDEDVPHTSHVRVQYYRVKVERVERAYEAARWWSFNAHPNGSVHSVPDGIPADVLADALGTLTDYLKDDPKSGVES